MHIIWAVFDIRLEGSVEFWEGIGEALCALWLLSIWSWEGMFSAGTFPYLNTSHQDLWSLIFPVSVEKQAA